jgi:4-hydroxybenzoate polyprenyltransferase
VYGIASVALADPLVAIRLGVAMTALQASIGALNDVIDAPRDAGHKPGKPIPAGLVSGTTARVVVVVAAIVGLGLSAPSGIPTLALGAVILAIGYGYDLAFKGTAWSWVPFAVGIPLLPVYAWLGSAGTVPASFAILIPVAVVAGSALAIANAQADLDRDAAAGVDSVAVRLGAGRSWALATGLLGIVVTAALVTLVRDDASMGAILVAGGAAVLIGVGSALGRRGDSARRERAWQVQAIGVGLLGAAWLAGMELANRPGTIFGG